jgi:hypothetical protein
MWLQVESLELYESPTNDIVIHTLERDATQLATGYFIAIRAIPK